MTYQETLAYLYRAAPSFQHVGAAAYKEGLGNTRVLDAHFGHPHRLYTTIHVAGTNGKGSVAHTLAAILQAEGYNVGLYTSPHLVDFRERIRVNGRGIDERRVIEFVSSERPFFEPLHPSFFELTTALAFLYFAEQHVDIAVIEVGLGGRLDCTNIITPALSIITNISLDHTRLLGDTLQQIAREKAGIIKHGVPVVVGESLPQTRPVFDKVADDLGAPLTYADDRPSRHATVAGAQLHGYCQTMNTRTILTAVDILRSSGTLTIGDDAVATGFAHVCTLTGLRGRWEMLRERPTVVCDTGHNVAAWHYLSRQLATQRCRTLRIVFGMVDDKDITAVLDMLPRHATYYWAQATTHRAIPATQVAQLAAQRGLSGEPFATVTAAYSRALHDAADDDMVFVGGSSYVVADLLAGL